MEFETNAFGQPVGRVVADWSPPQRPAREPIEGRWCRVEPLDPARHAGALYAADCLDAEGRSWTYLPYGPFPTLDAYQQWAADSAAMEDPLFMAVVPRDVGTPAGVASYLRIEPGGGAIEIGHLHFSPLLQRTPAATEALYLLMERAFQLGYRRLEWKCDALNAPSRRAASRLGFCHEGIFRQATVVKGRNRDTAWYAIVDADWPRLQSAFARWLDPANFDADGKQGTALSALTAT